MTELLEVAADVPGLGLVGKMPSLIGKVHSSVRDWWTKRGRQELYKLQEMAPAEIADYLPAFWAADLQDYRTSKDRPVVLFIDTYEALWAGDRAEGRFFVQDEWVRELVAHLSEVLWVVIGRQELRWKELDPDWGRVLDQYRVGELKDEDAQTFLTSCNIRDEGLQRAIIAGSKGVPFYLDLRVDTYYQIKDRQRREPAPTDFEGTPREIRERFLSYLDRSETETLKVLAVPRFWDWDLFGLLIHEFDTGYPVTAFDELCRFSFVQKIQGKHAWTIHPLMRDALLEYEAPELREKVHWYLFEYYNERLTGLEARTIAGLHETALAQALYHGQHVLNIEESLEWFWRARRPFDDAALWRFLTPLYEEVAGIAQNRLGPDHPKTAGALKNLGLLYDKQGRYKEAEPLLKGALKIYEEKLGRDHPDTAHVISSLAILYLGQGRYWRTEPLLKGALKIYEERLGRDHPNVAAMREALEDISRSRSGG